MLQIIQLNLFTNEDIHNLVGCKPSQQRKKPPSGKSILAKLLYFFREFLNVTYLDSIIDLECKDEIIKTALFYFEAYFPEYTWKNNDFEIVYKTDRVGGNQR